MKSKCWIYGILALAIIGIILISGCTQQSKPEAVTCNPPYIKVGTTCCLDQNNNNICDNDELKQTKSIEKTESKITLDYIEIILEKYQPNFKGAFVKLDHSDPCSFSGFFTDSRGACNIWKYPNEDVSSDSEGNLFSVTLFDFESNMPNINNDPFVYFQGGWDSETKTLSNGVIKIYGRETGYGYQKHYHFVCGDNYWIHISYSQEKPSIDDSPILKIIKEILNNC